MNDQIKKAVEEYQCSGCVCGSNIECYKEGYAIGCDKHLINTMMLGIGKLFLGMPKGFNRLGPQDKMELNIFKSYPAVNWEYNNIWNVPVWKYLNDNGHTLVRGIMPRRNEAFLHIFLENCIDKIDCIEITQKDIEGMD